MAKKGYSFYGFELPPSFSPLILIYFVRFVRSVRAAGAARRAYYTLVVLHELSVVTSAHRAIPSISDDQGSGNVSTENSQHRNEQHRNEDGNISDVDTVVDDNNGSLDLITPEVSESNNGNQDGILSDGETLVDGDNNGSLSVNAVSADNSAFSSSDNIDENTDSASPISPSPSTPDDSSLLPNAEDIFHPGLFLELVPFYSPEEAAAMVDQEILLDELEPEDFNWDLNPNPYPSPPLTPPHTPPSTPALLDELDEFDLEQDKNWNKDWEDPNPFPTPPHTPGAPFLLVPDDMEQMGDEEIEDEDLVDGLEPGNWDENWDPNPYPTPPSPEPSPPGSPVPMPMPRTPSPGPAPPAPLTPPPDESVDEGVYVPIFWAGEGSTAAGVDAGLATPGSSVSGFGSPSTGEFPLLFPHETPGLAAPTAEIPYFSLRGTPESSASSSDSSGASSSGPYTSFESNEEAMEASNMMFQSADQL